MEKEKLTALEKAEKTRKDKESKEFIKQYVDILELCRKQGLREETYNSILHTIGIFEVCLEKEHSIVESRHINKEMSGQIKDLEKLLKRLK